MLLRRISKHVKDQNWFAVALDFFIVIAGILIAFQITNWNDERADKAEYAQALARLDTEIKNNIITINSISAEVAEDLKIVGDALEAVLSCIDSEDNRSAVNAGFSVARASNLLVLRSDALLELTTSSRLLSQQSEQERKRFSDMMFYFKVAQVTSNFSAFHPLEKRLEDLPILGVGPRIYDTNEFYGVDTPQLRSFVLNTPIDLACQHDPLIKALVTWERWQGDLLPLAEQARKELEATQALLEASR